VSGLNELRCADFVPLVGQVFRVSLADAEPIPLALVSATEMGAPRSPEERRPFSLIFLGPESTHYLRQGVYRLEHAQLDGLDLFIVPIGPQAGRMQYEAIFT
jgi:hypothetical protein